MHATEAAAIAEAVRAARASGVTPYFEPLYFEPEVTLDSDTILATYEALPPGTYMHYQDLVGTKGWQHDEVQHAHVLLDISFLIMTRKLVREMKNTPNGVVPTGRYRLFRTGDEKSRPE